VTQSESTLAQHYKVLTKLARSESIRIGDLASTLREITEAASQTLNIARVNIWLYNEDRTKISCINSYELATGLHTSGMELAAVDYPEYFKALDEERTIIANDAHTDPSTAEFSVGYLDVNGITSMLDAPLLAAGTSIGIVCHEHIGPARVWTSEEQLFAGSLADLASLALESSERRQAEHALQTSERRTRAILANALDAIVTFNEQSQIIDWNPQAEVIFGWSSEQAIGKTLYDTFIPDDKQDGLRKGLEDYLKTGEAPILNNRIEVEAADKKGRKFPIELSVSPLHVGDSPVFSAFIRDITSRVRAELKVHELNANLEARVQKRTAQLNTAVVEKEKLLEQLRANSADLVETILDLDHKSSVIQADLERAQVIQRSLLPMHPPQLQNVRVDALYRPGMNVGGDLYDIAVLDDEQVALYVADATGHGVASAMLSVLFKQRLEMCDQAGSALAPTEVLTRANERLCSDLLTPGMFLTVAYILVNTRTLKLRVVSAGHTPILLLHEDGECIRLDHTGPALGISTTPSFTEHHLDLRSGDRLILHTDGLTDGIESYGTEALTSMITSTILDDALDGPGKLRKLLDDATVRARSTPGAGDADDVTLLVLEVGSEPSHLDNDPEKTTLSDDQSGQVETLAAGSEPGDLWIATDGDDTCLLLKGRGIWTGADTFRKLAKSALDAGRALRIDLSACNGLDSTYLGILHEIATLNAGKKVRIHRPNETVRGLLEELGLQKVIETICEDECEPTTTPVLVPSEQPTHDSHRLLLQAHKTLSELSEENKQRFSGVVEALRAEFNSEV
jgi:PAS domain S-box-containing protein